MDIDQFIKSLSQNQPDPSFPPLLKALWYDAKGNWDQAHDIADGFGSRTGDWVHAYLHRKEGDQWNAGYWYRRAGKSMPDHSLEEEWQVILLALLQEYY